jgi:glutamate/tyrosine decarboxylase-like PLP-dependent enzyme
MINELRSTFEKVEAAIASGPIVPDVTAGEIREYLHARYSFHAPLPLEDVVSDVHTMLQNWQVQVTHPRYFGLFNPSVTLASAAADTLVAMYNPQLANWRTSPAGNEMERHVLQWLTAKFGLPPETSAMFTTGGTEANLSAVVVALTHAFPAYGEDGLRSLPAQPVIYLTHEAHHSFNKIAHSTGLGRNTVRVVATDTALRLDLQDLARCVAEDRGRGLAPFMVVATGGTTAAGVIDPLPEIAQFCREAGLWLHVDAAWGGGAIISPTLAKHLQGIEHADSITCDAHKWLSVPMGCGMFFCRHAETVAQAFRAAVSYMPSKPVGSGEDTALTTDPYTTSMQWSRRFIGLKLFMTIAEQGEAGCAARVEHQARMGEVLRRSLAQTDWRIVNDTPLPLVCFTREGLVPGRLLQALREQQIAWMSEAELGGVPVIRACITSFKTTEAEITSVVGEINRLFHHEAATDATQHLELLQRR